MPRSIHTRADDIKKKQAAHTSFFQHHVLLGSTVGVLPASETRIMISLAELMICL
jgi:hypothetical protein